jgi:glycosyltransferase 2 family protein
VISATGNRWTTRRLLVLGLRWSVPIVILLAFALTGHLGSALRSLADVSAWWALPLVLVGIALPVSHAWRWCYLLKRVDSEISVAGSARVTALASLLNYAAPGFLGAPAKAIFARDAHGVPVGRSLPTLAAEQLLDAALLAIGGVVAIVIAGPVMYGVAAGAISLELMLAATVTFAVVIAVGIAFWIIARRFLPGFVTAVHQATVMLLRSRENLRPIAALTVTRWLLDMVAIGIASAAIGLRLNLFDILLVANLSLLIGLVAPVPGGLGVREAVMASLAGAVGVSIPAMLALAVLHRAGLAAGLPVVLVGAHLREWSSR